MIYFKHIQKTAGTTFKTLLRSNFGAYHVEANKTKSKEFSSKDYKLASKVFLKIKAVSGHNLPSPDHLKVPGIVPVIFLRDPVLRCVSHYQDQVTRGGLTLSFEEWISDPTYQNFMVRSVSGSEDLNQAKKILKEYFFFVGFTERFRESLELLNLLLEKPLILKFKTSVVARSNDIKESLLKQDSTLELLTKFNEKDQLLYQFAMNEIYLPVLDTYKDSLKLSETYDDHFGFRQKIKHKLSILQNNYVYRPAIKFMSILW